MADVRKRGFRERSDVETVQASLAGIPCLGPEDVDLAHGAGRVLAEDVRASVDVPHFARAVMDGYALRGRDTFGATTLNRLELAVSGESLPGRPFPGRVEEGCAVRITTGAPMPEGADAVLPFEDCEEGGTSVLVCAPVAPHKNVGACGEDVRKGQEVLLRGRRLRPQDVGLLASIGVGQIACVRRPAVEIIVTGSELLPPGSQPHGSQIVDSNSVVLTALVARDGGVALPTRHLLDAEDALSAGLLQSRADVTLFVGGTSVGHDDLIPELLSRHGHLDFHGVNLRPASPAGGGRIGPRQLFLLPGNPVSCLCAYEFFAGPTIRALGGRPRDWPHRRVRARLARKIVSAVGRTDYVRVSLEGERVEPIATSGASILSSTVRATGAVIVPRQLEGMAAGEEVEVLLYDEQPARLRAAAEDS
jgi:molybdopterin molybdotransferase